MRTLNIPSIRIKLLRLFLPLEHKLQQIQQTIANLDKKIGGKGVELPFLALHGRSLEHLQARVDRQDLAGLLRVHLFENDRVLIVEVVENESLEMRVGGLPVARTCCPSP